MKIVKHLYNTYLSYDADALEKASDQGFLQFREETDYGRTSDISNTGNSSVSDNGAIAGIFIMSTLLAFCSLIFF